MITTTELAEELGVAHVTVWRWVTRWHGHIGQGNRFKLTAADVLVARAWRHINGDRTDRGTSTIARARMCEMAERAIRSAPRRWLFLSARAVHTFDTAAEAALWWNQCGLDAGQIVDLDPPRTLAALQAEHAGAVA